MRRQETDKQREGKSRNERANRILKSDYFMRLESQIRGISRPRCPMAQMNEKEEIFFSRTWNRIDEEESFRRPPKISHVGIALLSLDFSRF